MPSTRDRDPALVVYITTVPLSALTLLRGQLGYLREHGFDVVVVSSPGEELSTLAELEGVRVFSVSMRRDISPVRDLISLFRLFRLLCRLQPTVVNASTPKASLLGTLAAWMARVPVRIYTLRGLRLETVTGLKKQVLRLAERATAAAATHVVCVSEGLRRVCVDLGLAPESKTLVLGAGSSNGVDAERFSPPGDGTERSLKLRGELGIPEDAPVIGFVGRLARDKGVPELFDAFQTLSECFPKTRLILLGRHEDEDPIPPSYRRRLGSHPRVALVGFALDTAPFFHLMDLLALPSYREGFPNVVLEAAVAGVPTVGFRSTGVTDAVVDGQTGLLVSPGDGDALAKACTRLLENEAHRTELGAAARQRALKDFSSERIWEKWSQLYRSESTVCDSK
ncbi:MAG: glycosyltransferase family 4 protein [Rubrobacteraceae bacterium]